MRQPVHVLYGGAHLFQADICRRMGDLALRALQAHAPDAVSLASVCGIPADIAGLVYERVLEKLRREPVEDLRIDFEDGFGVRSDEEEDSSARTAAGQLARARDQNLLPDFIGIRIKSFNGESRARSFRTLDLFMTALGPAPRNFTVTLPKVTSPEEVRGAINALSQYGLNRLELMIETPHSIFILPQLIEAAGGLCTAAHFGGYDYTAALGIAAPHQDLQHPACDFARFAMQAHLAGTPVNVSDGATNILPIGDAPAIHRGWNLHFRHVRRALENGFYQSWDLHPSQLVSRYAAVYSFFLAGLTESSDRLKNFIAKAATATQVGGVFDDAATGQGLLNYFRRAVDCGAVPETEVIALTGLTLDELRSASFDTILKGRSTNV